MDVIDAVLNDERWAVLRRQRPDYVRFSQGSHDVLITPSDPGGITRSERAAAGKLIAEINGDAALAEHYRALIDPPLDAPLDRGAEKTRAVLAHVERVARAPREATPEQLRALEAVGLSAQDIVSLSQLIAFVSFQTRVLAGMRLLSAERAA